MLVLTMAVSTHSFSNSRSVISDLAFTDPRSASAMSGSKEGGGFSPLCADEQGCQPRDHGAEHCVSCHWLDQGEFCLLRNEAAAQEST